MNYRLPHYIALPSTQPYFYNSRIKLTFYSLSCLLHSHASQAQSSSTQPCPTLSYNTLPYPNLSYTTLTPPNPWVAHSTLPRQNFGTICPRIGTKPPTHPAWGPRTLTQAETLSRPWNLGWGQLPEDIWTVWGGLTEHCLEIHLPGVGNHL